MKAPIVKFIEIIEKDFSLLQELYLRVLNVIEKNDTSQIRSLKANWKDDLLNQEVRDKLLGGILNYYEKGDFQSEVKYNLINNLTGGIEYIKLVLANVNRFIEHYFPSSVNEYFEDIDESHLLVEELNDPQYLTDGEFLKAVQFQFIQFFTWFEEQFYWIYPFYVPYFINYKGFEKLPYSGEQRKFIYPQHINLAYPKSLIKDVINAMHGALIDIFIKTDKKAFKLHFKPFKTTERIKWYGNPTQLVLLLNGKDVRSGPIFENHKIKFNNQDIIKLILDHFEDADGNSYDVDKLLKTKENVDNPKRSHRDVDGILNLFYTVENLEKSFKF